MFSIVQSLRTPLLCLLLAGILLMLTPITQTAFECERIFGECYEDTLPLWFLAMKPISLIGAMTLIFTSLAVAIMGYSKVSPKL